MRRKSNLLDEIQRFERFLFSEEKSTATINKYLRDIRHFYYFLGNRRLTKEEVLAYKAHLMEQYAAASVNSMLIALNGFLRFIGMQNCCVRLLKIQRQIFCSEDKELTKQELQQLVKAAGNSRLSLVIQTICGTGIRVSELQFITVEAVKLGKAIVRCKNKTRIIFIPTSIQALLKEYILKTNITNGMIFITKSGKPLNRSNIWRDMKALWKRAEVPPDKVFPHNLRHLFARTFYNMEKDIVRMADLLGHSSVDTTRIYTTQTGSEHVLQLERVERQLIT